MVLAFVIDAFTVKRDTVISTSTSGKRILNLKYPGLAVFAGPIPAAVSVIEMLS